MSQPETALGDAPAPNSADGQPSEYEAFAKHAAPLAEDDPKPEDDATDDEPLYGEEGSGSEQPEGEDEPEAEPEPDLPAIKPPASWTAEEKEAFAELPRNLQETVTRREAERDKALYAKTQEAARVRGEVEQQAIAELQSYAQQQITALQALLPQIPEKPAAMLQLTDPQAWAAQQDYYDWAVAQHQAVQQQIAEAQTIAQRSQQEQAQRAYAQDVAILQETFPEYLDPVAGVEHRKALGSLATELGFSETDLAAPTARDITALRKVAEWKAKADKFDAAEKQLKKDDMEYVRSFKKNAPKVSRPGTSTGREQMASQRLKADREAARAGDKNAELRVFSQYR